MKYSRHYYRTVYLHSDHWRDLRAIKLAENPACEKCDSRDRLDCHHKRYRRLYNCTSKDLQTLCRRCHETKHAKTTVLSDGGGMRGFTEARKALWLAARAKVSKLGRDFSKFNIGTPDMQPKIRY